MTGIRESLEELRWPSGTAGWLVDVRRPETENLNGGRFVPGDFEAIEQRPDATGLRVSGLDQTMFEELVSRYGRQFSAIHFRKCPRIADFTPLESLPGLRLVSFFWNQRATRLWNMAKTPALVGLQIEHFTRLHDLTDVATGTSLVELELGDGVWPQFVIESLDPLAQLQGLKALRLRAKRIDDRRVEALGALKGLRSLEFPANQFTTAQVAWLRARLPDSLQGGALEPVWYVDAGITRDDGTVLDRLLVGKGKPYHLNSERDAVRIQKHIAEFNRMVANFRANPHLLADR